MTKPTRWKGELAKPIRVNVNRPHGFYAPDPHEDPEAEKKIQAENDLMCRLRDDARAHAETQKLRLLCEHCGVEHDDLRALALAIARACIPGFKFIDPLRPIVNYGPQSENQKKAGRPRVWDVDRLMFLAVAVDTLRAKEGLTDREALHRLSREKEWSPPGNHRGNFSQWRETLESRLQDAKDLQRRTAAFENQLSQIERRIATEG
jgi:hypothetical protein